MEEPAHSVNDVGAAKVIEALLLDSVTDARVVGLDALSAIGTHSEDLAVAHAIDVRALPAHKGRQPICRNPA
jgi:hypothetical protein